MRVLTESIRSAHAPVAAPSVARWVIRPSLPTTVAIRAVSCVLVLQQLGDVVERLGDRRPDDRLIDRQPDAEIPFLQRLDAREELPGLVMPVARRQHRRRFRSGIRCSIDILVCMRSWSLFLDRHGSSLMVRM